jgi:hypothetical protein
MLGLNQRGRHENSGVAGLMPVRTLVLGLSVLLDDSANADNHACYRAAPRSSENVLAVWDPETGESIHRLQAGNGGTRQDRHASVTRLKVWLLLPLSLITGCRILSC